MGNVQSIDKDKKSLSEPLKNKLADKDLNIVFCSKPLLKFKLEYKSAKWVIFIRSEYDKDKNIVAQWQAVTEDEQQQFTGEWHEQLNYHRVKFFNSQLEAYEHVANNFKEGTIVELDPTVPGFFSRLAYLFFPSI